MATRPRPGRRHRRHRRIRNCRAGSARSHRDCCLLLRRDIRDPCWATTACSSCRRRSLRRSRRRSRRSQPSPCWPWPCWSWPCWSWPCWPWPCWSWPCWSWSLLVCWPCWLGPAGLGPARSWPCWSSGLLLPSSGRCWLVALLAFALLVLPAASLCRRPLPSSSFLPSSPSDPVFGPSPNRLRFCHRGQGEASHEQSCLPPHSTGWHRDCPGEAGVRQGPKRRRDRT